MFRPPNNPLQPEEQPPSVTSPPRATRRYRYDIPYLLPKDADEAGRQEFQHFLLNTILGANYLAPISAKGQKPLSIIDLGCGTGIWCHEMSREFPKTQVYGLDIEYMPRVETPDNFHFIAGNLLHELPFNANTFDFVHQRFLINAIPETLWPGLVERLCKITCSGGWLELVEEGGDHFSREGPLTTQIVEDIFRVAAVHKIDTRRTRSLGEFIQRAGMVHVEKKIFLVPVGRWGGRIGARAAINLQATLNAFKDLFVRYLRHDPDEFDIRLARIVQEWEQYHSQYPIYVYFGQKP
jgi:SAM-dependent methyltransferase